MKRILNSYMYVLVVLLASVYFAACNYGVNAPITEGTNTEYRAKMFSVSPQGGERTEIADNSIRTLRRSVGVVFSSAGSRAPSGNIPVQTEWRVLYGSSQYYQTYDTAMTYSFTTNGVATVRLKVWGNTTPNTSDTSGVTAYFDIRDSVIGGTGPLEISGSGPTIMPSGQRDYLMNYPVGRMPISGVTNPALRFYGSTSNIQISSTVVNDCWQNHLYLYDNERKDFNYLDINSNTWSLATAFSAVPQSIYYTGQIGNFYSIKFSGGNLYTTTSYLNPINPGFGDSVLRFSFTPDSMFVYTRIQKVSDPNPQQSPWVQDNLFNGQQQSRPLGASGWAVKSYSVSWLSSPPNGIITYSFGIGDRTIERSKIENTFFWYSVYSKLCFQVVLPRPGNPGGIIALRSDGSGILMSSDHSITPLSKAEREKFLTIK